MNTDTKHFIKEIEIKNFKCFNSLETKNFGRINLIGGKNNVGKTAFLESLELSITSNDPIDLAYSLQHMIKRRQYNNRRNRYFELDFIYDNTSFLTLSTNLKKIAIEYFDELPEIAKDISEEKNLFIEHEPAIRLKVNNIEKFYTVDRIINRIPLRRLSESYNHENINFIVSSTIDERDIAILYGKLIDLGRESFLDKSLNLFDSNIIALKQKYTDNDVVLKLALKNRKMPVLLSSMGEGINRYIAILSAIWASKGGYLFIDEIENGLHYSNYDKLWELVIQTSDKANVQVFATTHSKECIESYARVAKNLNDKEIRFVSMGRNNENEIKAMVYNYDWFIDSVEQEQEVRGW